MISYPQKEHYTLEDLRAVVRILRHEGGCPWDQVQTHQSLRRDFLEETYEAIEAIDRENPALLCEELGDVLLQVVFHADIEQDAGRFTLDDVADGITKKMIARHPHVFGEATARDMGELLSNWETLKRQEKGQATVTDAMEAVARTLPALWRAEKVQKKAAGCGFDWADASEAIWKLPEEAEEVREALENNEGEDRVAEELGDLMLASVTLSRFLGRDPEEVLNAATDKFIQRFAAVERLAAGQDFHDISTEELVKLWKKAKEETEA